MEPRTFITNRIEVWHGYAKNMGDNGLTADALVSCCLAPAVHADSADPYTTPGQYIYLTTNGDPVLIGWLSEGGFELADGTSDVIDAEPWLAKLIDDVLSCMTSDEL